MLTEWVIYLIIHSLPYLIGEFIVYMTAKYPSKCSKTGRDILPGDRIIYYRSTRKAVLVGGTRSATFNANGVSTTVYRNARGLCEDAPCCGCCTG